MSSSEARPVKGGAVTADDERGAVIGVLQQTLNSLEDAHEEPGERTGGSGLTDDPEYKRAKKRAMNMLAARDHGSAELREKLLGKDHPPQVVDALISGLQRSHLLDDGEFAKAFVRAKREGRALSKRALSRELTKKGIAQEDADAALEHVDDEFDLALGVAEKKAAATFRLPYETRKRRILAMLARRGFPQGTCLRAADAAIAHHPGAESE